MPSFTDHNGGNTGSELPGGLPYRTVHLVVCSAVAFS